MQIICVYSPDKLLSIVWLLHASISLSASKVLVKNKCVNKYLNSFWHIIHSQKLVEVNFLMLAYFNLVNLFFFWNWILAFITFFLTLLLFYLKVHYIFLNFYCNKLVSLFQYSSKDKHPGTRYFLLKIYMFLVIIFTSFYPILSKYSLLGFSIFLTVFFIIIYFVCPPKNYVQHDICMFLCELYMFIYSFQEGLHGYYGLTKQTSNPWIFYFKYFML